MDWLYVVATRCPIDGILSRASSVLGTGGAGESCEKDREDKSTGAYPDEVWVNGVNLVAEQIRERDVIHDLYLRI